MKKPPARPTTALETEEGSLLVDDQPLYYRRLTPPGGPSAADPTLVFLHEALGCTAMWHDFPARLAADTGLAAVSYDRAGYGRSPATPQRKQKGYLRREAEDVLPKVLQGLAIDRALLVGHSDGGSIALLAAAILPGVIAGIVTEAAHVFVEPITLEGIRETVAAYAPRQLEKRLARYHGANTRALFLAWAETWLAESFRDWNIEDCLGRIRCPALIIQGCDDPYGSKRQVEAIVAGIGDRARALFLPACGHAPHRDAAGRVGEAVAAFLAALRPHVMKNDA
jgi:pimeloyl-ACP methyl ester carboxylesterase